MHANKMKVQNQGYKFYFNNLVKANKLETQKILIDEKHYKD